MSDDNYAELHEFAGDLGLRRIGFQGDHYDLDSVTYERAVAAGAALCDSRELVRRLRDAGLRRRPRSFERWQLSQRFEHVGSSQLAALEVEISAAPTEAIEPLRRAATTTGTQAFSVVRTNSAAAVVIGGGAEPVPIGDDPTLGLFVRRDLSGWSVEVITPSPPDEA